MQSYAPLRVTDKSLGQCLRTMGGCRSGEGMTSPRGSEARVVREGGARLPMFGMAGATGGEV
jgi:hypothetical protein